MNSINQDDDATVIKSDYDDNEYDTMKFAVDIPKHPILGETWENIDYFETRQAAIAYCKKQFGADKEGRINLVTSL